VERDPTYRILVNGAPADSVAARDRGLAFGDGVFRTLAVRAGRPLNWTRHLERLAFDCAALDLPMPEAATLRDEIGRVAPGDAVAKVIVTRGVSTRGYSAPGSPQATRIVAAFDPFDPGNAAREGVRVRRCALVLSEQPRLAGVKSLNRLENVLARAEWSDPGVREGLLTDGAGRLIEATAANVFLALGGRLATPRLARCGVSGAQRARVMALAALAGIACEEREIEFAEMQRADEVFLTNSLIGIWPVVALDAWRWEIGTIARRLQSAIAEEDARAS
jgi:4-amino-4-deoxychorismate lyase